MFDASDEVGDILYHDEISAGQWSDFAEAGHVFAQQISHLLGIGILHLESFYHGIGSGSIKSRFLAQNNEIAVADFNPVTLGLRNAVNRLLHRDVVQTDGDGPGYPLG